MVLALTGRPARIAPDPASALELASALAPPEGLICITGSLFLAAEARAVLLAGQDRENAGKLSQISNFKFQN